MEGNMLSDRQAIDPNGQNISPVISQQVIDLELEKLRIQDHEINMVILDESGQIIVQKGDIKEKIVTGFTAQPVIAAAILLDGKVNLNSVVQGNSIVCRDKEGKKRIYPNWREEPETMTFAQALTGASQTALISAALNSDPENLKEILECQGFSNFDITSEDSIASCASGQRMRISIYDLAKAYDSVFMKKENSQLRSLVKQGLQQQYRITSDNLEELYGEKTRFIYDNYNYDLDMAGASGTGSEIVSNNPAQISIMSTYVGDCYFGNQKVVLAVSSYSDSESEKSITSTDLIFIVNNILTQLKKSANLCSLENENSK